MTHKTIRDSTALVTGANRGIGRALVQALVDRGASKVYAGARDPESLRSLVESPNGRIIGLQLDVTNSDQITSASKIAHDVDLLINNAGVALGGWLGDPFLQSNARREMEVNYFGPLNLLEQFSEALIRLGGSVVNVSSVAGLTNFPIFATYSASKAAVHSLTQATRMLLGPSGVSVFGVYPGPVDTDLAKEIPMEKASPASVAERILDGLEDGTEDIFTDTFAAEFASVFQTSPKASEQQFAAMAAEGSN